MRIQRVILAVPALHCDQCISSVAGVLQRFPGIITVSGDLQEKVLQVRFREDEITPTAMEAQLAEIGYPVSSVKYSPAAASLS